MRDARARVEKLERESQRLSDEIEQVHSEWRARQRDGSVPGAVEGGFDAGESPESEAAGEPSESREPSESGEK
jgi:hypothetical protein